jgi:cytochrome b subunit of formate dehydrogenase
VNILCDVIAFVCFVALAVTGIVIHTELPPGSGGMTLWGMTRHEWGHLHLLLAITFAAVMAVHLLLHRRWIGCVIRGGTVGAEGRFWRKAIIFVVLLLLMGLAAAPFFTPTKESSGRGGGKGWRGGRP